jgi:hypothetical protein
MVRTLAQEGRAPTEAHYLSDHGKPLEMSNGLYKRVIPLKEVAATGHYSDMAKLAKIFNHEVLEDNHGTWRWRRNLLTTWVFEHGPFHTPSNTSDATDHKEPWARPTKQYRGTIDLNNLWTDFHNGMFSLEEMMKFYMEIGYSLCGYAEVFGQREAFEFGLPDAKKPKGNRDSYTETLIDYVARVHKGKVLSL